MMEAPKYHPSGRTNSKCGVCGRDSIKPKTKGADLQAIAEGGKREQETFWIQCDVCDQWYHGMCVNVEEYESALIEKYHCDGCAATQGPTLMKQAILDHRYDFEDATQLNEPTQIGTKRFIEEFKKTSEQLPFACSEHLALMEDGHEFSKTFNRKEVWKKIYLIKNIDGLGIQLPHKGFSLKDCVDVVGATRMVDTIDVYKQYTFQMSFGRFYEHFTAKERPRLYNILSLEFSNSKLCRIVQPPKLVAELSWVHKFWPEIRSNTPIASMINSKSVFKEHLKAKPEVELFCLVGMKDSYTDFHIDFGGSSVWYHVFQGQKVFYVVEPTEENVKSFADYQNSSDRTEVFFGDLLPPGSLFKVVINEGETLMIPAGWIHAVWTPCDSLVFGGNFLHSLNIEMQLRIYNVEVYLETEDRFMFPFFELVNWYAAASILQLFRETNERGEKLDDYLLKGTKALVASLRRWINRDEATDGDLSNSEWVRIYRKLKRRLQLYEKRYRGDLNSEGANASEANTSKSHDIKDIASILSGEAEAGQEMKVDGEGHKSEALPKEEVDDLSVTTTKKETRQCHFGRASTSTSGESTFTYEGATSVHFDGDGSMMKRKRLREQFKGDDESALEGNHNNAKDALPYCDQVKGEMGSPITNESVEKEMQTSLVSMFSHRSIHGRVPKPSAWVTTATAKPIVCDTAHPNIDAIGTPTAKKIPPPHEEGTSMNRSLQHSSNGTAAVLVNKTEMDRSGTNKRKKPTTVRQRLAQKLKIKF